MELKEQFEEAVAKSKTLKAKPDNDVLLKLYSLYKQGTEGDAPEKGDYAMFDFVGKAKHDAWLKYSGMKNEEAMNQYIAFVELLIQNDQ